MIIQRIRKNVGFIKISLKDMWAYSFDFMMWSAFFILQMLMFYFVWRAIFSNSGQEIIKGFTFGQMITYYVFSIIVMLFTSTNNVDERFADDIKHGNLNNRITRPVSLFWSYLFDSSGHAITSIVMFAVPLLLFSQLFLVLSFGDSAHLLIFGVSVLLAYVLNFAFVFLFGTIGFWVKEYRGISKFKRFFMYVFTGALIPLTFFPLWFQGVSNYLPFQYVRFSVIQIGLGNLTILESLKVILFQIIWIALLILSIRWIIKKGLKHYTGAGT